MAYTLITRNVDSALCLKYTGLEALPYGQTHSHYMPVPIVMHAHEDAGDPEDFKHLLNHFHPVLEYKYHRHMIDSVEPILHAHDGINTHKHTILYHDDTYKYSVTRQTGSDTPIVTPDVGTSAVIRIPDGESYTDSEDADVVVVLADAQTLGVDEDITVGPSQDNGYNEPAYNYETIEGVTESVPDISVRLELNGIPEAKPVTTSSSTDLAMHKGVVGANPAIQSSSDGDNNQAIMLYSSGSLDGDILGTGVGGAELYSATYHKQTPNIGIYFTEPDTPKYIKSPVLSGFAGWSLVRHDETYEAGHPLVRFYKLGTSPEGVWTNRTCNEYLTLSSDPEAPASDLSFVGIHALESEGYGTEIWGPVTYSVDAWYIGAAYKKVAANAFDPTGTYVGVAPNTGQYIVTSTATPGTFSASWKTLPELMYSPIKKAYHGQHQHDITYAPTNTSIEHDHTDTTLDYSHWHEYNLPTHKHVPSGADLAAHKHTVALTDHSHEPVIFGIWRTANLLSNVTFKRADNVSPWVLFAVDTVPVNYPSPTVGAEIADVEWPVLKAVNLTINMESTVDLATDIDFAVEAIEAGTQEGTRVTDPVTIEDVPLVYGDYIAGDVSWPTGTKTALAYHIGKGEAAGTSEEQSLVNPLDDTISVLVRNEGVLERMRIGRLPTGIVHMHDYTDAAFQILAHQHSYHWHGDYAHTHKMYISNPHSHPNKVIPTESHRHNVVSCEPDHTHVVKTTSEASNFVVGITNVVDDTFDEDIDSSEDVLYPNSGGSSSGAETGDVDVTPADNAYSLLHVVSLVDPTLDGEYQKRFVSPNNWENYFATWVKSDDPTKTIQDNGTGWYLITGGGYRTYFGSPVGDYLLVLGDFSVYATVTYSTKLGIKDVSISKDITTSAEKKFVPHNTLGGAALNAYIWGWTTETGSPDLSTFDTGIQLESWTIPTLDGGTNFTMTGVVEEKLHSGI